MGFLVAVIDEPRVLDEMLADDTGSDMGLLFLMATKRFLERLKAAKGVTKNGESKPKSRCPD
jgi:hypothetical protein